jgi:hypothetical protein
MRLHQAIVRPAQNAAKAVFGVNPPMLVTRLFEAFERRIFFGTNRIHRDLSMETVFVARNSPWPRGRRLLKGASAASL